jgi:microsomal dipeptidase-like Zn-dependent dipeptidase
MSRGMLIDTEHLSAKAFEDAMKIAEQRRYPVLASHAIPYDLGSTKDEKSRTELARRNVDLKRIFQVGGIVAPMLGTPTGAYLRNGQAQVPVCKWSGTGSVDQWANAYLLLRDLAPGGGLSADGGHIALDPDTFKHDSE